MMVRAPGTSKTIVFISGGFESASQEAVFALFPSEFVGQPA